MAAPERLELLPKRDEAHAACGGPRHRAATGPRARREGGARLACGAAARGALASALVATCLCALGRCRLAAPWRALRSGPAAGARRPAAFLEEFEVRAIPITDKPQSDPRVYQYAVLENGLKVLNVLDSKALQVAFAGSVRAGLYDDPVELPGLAHFCEHMLFLGTKKYPEPSGFDRFMSTHGGFNNAYTDSEVTVYFGEVSRSAEREALDRFAGFFTDPLFSKKFVEKEVHAIDSEHHKNVQEASSRIWETMRSLANPDSPVSRFHTGDLETLFEIPKKNGTNPVDALKVYYKDFYCPSKMSVVTISATPLEEQLATAAELFGRIPAGSERCQEPVRNFSDPAPFGPEQLGQWQVIQGTTPEAQIWLSFPLPDVTTEFLSHPLRYILYVIEYTGTDSMARVLQDDLGLVNGVSVSSDMTSAGTLVFIIFSLTDRGVRNQQLVLDVLFAYLATLRLDGVNSELYQTIADVNNLSWNWTEAHDPSDAASDLVEKMTRLPMDKVLSGDDRIDKLDPYLAFSLLTMLVPSNMNGAYVDPAADLNGTAAVHGHAVQSLPHFGVRYYVQEIAEAFPEEAAARWEAWFGSRADRDGIERQLAERIASANLTSKRVPFPQAPRPIQDVPRDISLEHMEALPGDLAKDGLEASLFGQPPAKLRGGASAAAAAADGRALEPSGSNIWYRSGWVTISPKVEVYVRLEILRREDEPELSALDTLRLDIFSQLLQEQMGPKMVDLTATGVSYGISASAGGLAFSFGGFAPMLPRLVGKVLEEFNSFNANASITEPCRFERVVNLFRQSLTTYNDMPISYAVEARSLLLSRGEYSRNETLAVLGSADLASSARSVGELLLSRPLQLTALAMGNFAEEDARWVVDEMSRGIEIPDWIKLSTGKGKVEEVMPVISPKDPVELRLRNPRLGDPNDVAIVTIVYGVSTVESRVALGLIGMLLHPLAYEELRTVRQLGYVVSAEASRISNVQYISASVQGTKLRADDQEAAIELLFNDLMPKRLANLSDEELASIRDAFREELLQPPESFGEEVAHFRGPVLMGGRCFSLYSACHEYLNSSAVTRDLLVSTWRDLVNPWEEGTRKKIVTKLFAGEVPARPTEDEATAAWKRQGVPDAAVPMLLRELKAAQVLDTVDSQARARLAKRDGHFPTDLNCELADRPKKA